MIEITIDYNNDVLIINGDETEIKMKIKNAAETMKVVYEVINAVFALVGDTNVRLSKIDEDTRTTIEEW